MAGKLFIASPAYSSSYCGEYVESLVATIKDCQQFDIKTVYRQVNGVHWIDIARDILCHIFLHTDCTHMIQIDSDLGWSADAPRRMMGRNRSIIGGQYPLKTDLVSFSVSDEKVSKVDRLSGGFLMISRDVIEKMSQELPKYKCSSMEYGQLHVAPLFTRQMYADHYVGEDYAFCDRATQMGYDLWLEKDIEFSHVGIKAWKGNLARSQ